jgi:hypothetical protein
MTKRHYEMIAGVLRDALLKVTDRRALIRAFGLVLSRDNPRFDYLRFLKASEP